MAVGGAEEEGIEVRYVLRLNQGRDNLQICQPTNLFENLTTNFSANTVKKHHVVG